LIGTILGVFVIPVLFVIFQYLQEKITVKRQNRDEAYDSLPSA